MKTRMLAIALATTSAALAAGPGTNAPAGVTELTLNVPVTVSHVQPGFPLYVRCLVCGKGACGEPAPGQKVAVAPDILAIATKPVPLSNGSFSGTIEVVYRPLPDQVFGQAKRYACRLANGPDGWLPVDFAARSSTQPITSFSAELQ